MLRLLTLPVRSLSRTRRYSTVTRHDEKWNHLRNDEALKKKVGEFIELPDLPGPKPKGLTQEDISRFLLTKQRWEILSEVSEAIGTGPLRNDVNNGLCLSGPHGVGKSVINYLLASIAYVRGWFLQYIPLCGNWIKYPSDDDRAIFFLNRFEELNKDLLSSVTKTIRYRPERTLADVLELDLPLLTVQHRLEFFLSRVVEKPVLFLFDEHNELWKLDPTKSYVPAEIPYFRTYTTWTQLSGPRLYTIYAGSAHSKFEENLPSGEDRKLRFIRPFNRIEACKLIEDLQIPNKISLSAEAVHDEITGGVPRQIVSLQNVNNVKSWRVVQEKTYFALVKKTYSGMSKGDQESFISFLHQVFGPSKYVGRTPSAWYDKGLFFIDNDSCTHPLNPLAEAALFALYAQNVQQEIIDQQGRTGSEIGAVFEREVIKGFIKLPRIELRPQYLKNPKPRKMERKMETKMEPAPLSLAGIARILYFDDVNEIPRLPSVECRLIKPRSQIFASWDFIIEDAHTKHIVFVQTSTDFPNVHDSRNGKGTSKIASSFHREEENEPNQIERVLDSLFQTKGSKANVKDGSFVIKLDDSIVGWKIVFLCVTTQHDIKLKSRKWKWKDVLVAGRETLEPLKLRFTK